MNNMISNLIDNSVQCWSCSIFDDLFMVISKSAAAAYSKISYFCIILFCVLFAFFVLNAVWQNIKGGAKDSWYTKSVQHVFINSIFVFAILGMGVAAPRFMTQITFEPVANIALIYEENMLQQSRADVDSRVQYTPTAVTTDESEYFFRPQLRDTIIQIAKTTITQFQSYIKLGLAIIDKALTWKMLLGIGSFIKHIILFFIGIYISWYFLKFFFKFLCYFADIIVAMMFFAFFFPLSLIMMSFKGAENVPSWMSNLGKGMGADQIKKLISAIVSLAAAVITYTVIMVIIARFFSAPGTTVNDLMLAITSGEVFEADLDSDNLAQITIMGSVVLVYVLNFIYGQIPQVTNKIMEAFNIKLEKNEFGDKVADDMMAVTKVIVDDIKKAGKVIIDGGAKKDDKPKDDKDKK
ncbi:MAG: hypothetical protein MJ170_01625 [Alphaproteobacteria bacterium]|nr:hypothetical protein [Alphaproteobacteria bacterium]